MAINKCKQIRNITQTSLFIMNSKILSLHKIVVILQSNLY